MVVTSIKINSERQAYVDFTVPFLGEYDQNGFVCFLHYKL